MQRLCVFLEVRTQSINAYYKKFMLQKVYMFTEETYDQKYSLERCDTSEIHNILGQRCMRCRRHFSVCMNNMSTVAG